MNKQEKKGVVPVRRFPEFLDAGQWNVVKLRRLAQRTKLKNSDHLITRVLTNSAEFGVVDQRDFFDKDIATQGNLDGYYVVAEGDYVYNPRVSNLAPVGPISKNKIGNGVMSPLYTVFRFDNTNNEFFEYYFKSAHWHEYLRFVSNSGARHDRMAITADSFMDMPVPAPHPDEQQKIANCLQSVDALINVQTQKLDVLKRHKKGLLQQIFPTERETVPKRRFPEFQDMGAWRTEELSGKTLKVGSGSTPSGGDKNYRAVGRPFVRSQNVGWGCLILDDVAYIDEEMHASFPATEIQKDDVLLNITGASIGRSAVANLKIEGGNVNQHVCIIRTKKKELNPFFLNQFLISAAGQHQIDSFQAGGNRQGLNFAQIRSFSIPIPPTMNEQQMISDCLTSLDELITAQTQKIDALKVHKEGLMQQLFPAMDQVIA